MICMMTRVHLGSGVLVLFLCGLFVGMISPAFFFFKLKCFFSFPHTGLVWFGSVSVRCKFRIED